jgi:hypothetical protein
MKGGRQTDRALSSFRRLTLKRNHYPDRWTKIVATYFLREVIAPAE